MRLRACGLGLAVGFYALTTALAAAAPRLISVATHMPRGVTPAGVVIEPDGTAYVQGESLSREELVPEVYVYSPSGRLLRKLAIPPGTAVEAFGNGQLYLGAITAEHLYGANPQSGAAVSQVGAQGEGFPGTLGFPRGLAVGPTGTIYETGGEISVPEPGDPESVTSIHPIETFTAGGDYSGYIQPQPPAMGDLGVFSANSAGEVLAGWASSQGIGEEGVISPQGTVLTEFSVFPPDPEVKGGSFSADGSSIYAGVVVHQGSRGSTFVAKLSLSGHVLERIGNIPIHDAANFWEYDSAAVDAHGDGWAVRSVPGKLYRFHA